MIKYKKYIVLLLLICCQYLFLNNYIIDRISHKDMIKIYLFLYIFFIFKEQIIEYISLKEILLKHVTYFTQCIIMITIICYQKPISSFIFKEIFIICIITLIDVVVIFLCARFLPMRLLFIGDKDSLKEMQFKNCKYVICEINRQLELDHLDLKNIIKTNKIEQVIIGIKDIKINDLEKIISEIEDSVIKINIIPDINTLYNSNFDLNCYFGKNVLSVKNNRMSLKRKIIKRILDIIGALFGIIILALLYIKYGLKIKKDGGPIFFKHDRIGRELKIFKMYKFRTMFIDAEKRLKKLLEEDLELKEEFYKNFKLKNDPRITEVGQFLRKTSLDEFPQFINVLKGDMSIVGPRPVIKEEIELYYGQKIAKKIFQVKPGITGMWQAHGRSDIEDYNIRIALDIYYARNWSIWLDLIIIIKTIKNVIRKEGAY